MKATRIYTLLALLLMAGGVKMQGQEPLEFFSIGQSVFFGDAVFVNHDHLLVRMLTRYQENGNWCATQHLLLLDDKGEMVDSVYLFTNKPSIGQRRKPCSIQCFADGSFGMLVMKFSDDTLRLQKIGISDDLQLSYLDYDWQCTDYYTDDNLFEERFVANKDGSIFYAYPSESLTQYETIPWTTGFRLIKFDAEGHLLNEITFENVPFTGRMFRAFELFPTPDSLGCRMVMRNLSQNPAKYDCYTMDADLNIVEHVENIDRLSYPRLSGKEAFFKMNPYNGKTYSINCETYWAPGDIHEHDEDILMSVFDADHFEQLAYTWGITSAVPSAAGYKNSIDFDSDGGIYMAGGMDKLFFTPSSVYVAYLDENLNKLNEIYYSDTTFQLYPGNGICLSPAGDLFLICTKIQEPEDYGAIYKIPKEAFDGIEEAHDAGFAVAMAYPNPGKDVLNIRTGLKDARVEVYDMSGRMVYRQEIAENVTGIDAGGWASGTYIWKVYTGVSTGSTTLVETGKWIKE